MLVFLRSTLVLLVVSSIQAQTPGFKPIYHQDEIIRSTKAKEVLKYMNLSAPPCHDFFEFACGNWAKYHLPPRDHELATPETYLHAKIDHDLQLMLDEQVTLDDGTTGRKVKEFYKSCTSAERNGQLQQAFFSDFIEQNGGFPAVPGSNWHVHHQHNYNWQEVVGKLRHHYGLDILIGLEIDINHLSLEENSIYLGEPGTLIPAALCTAEGTKRVDIREREYEFVEQEVAENLRKWLTLKINDAEKLAADIVKFEFELCTAMKPANANADRSPMLTSYARKTLIDFSHQFNDSINFNEFVATSFGMPIYKPVFMTAEGYYVQLIKTVREHNKTTIANYIMYRALSMLDFPHDDAASRRPQHCLNVLKRYFPKAVGDMYQRKYSNANVKSEIEQIFDKIKDSFYNSLLSAWIEEGTSRMGKSKLAEILLYFPFYEKMNLNSLQFDRANYWHNLAQIMAQAQQQQPNRILSTGIPGPNDELESYEARLKYRATFKRIDIAWGLLQEPYYQPTYPSGMRFAMVGQRLAHAIATAFDDLSWSSDFLGLTNWDPQTAEGYKNRTKCFRRQVSNYLYDTPVGFQNETRLRELIAASSGLNVAFKAYLTWLDYLNPNNDFGILSKETLPELNFTNTQLFFIAYAQMHCRAEKEAKPAPVFNPMQRHTLERYEVNGPLRNFVEFARDFGCPAGTEMNPADKCVIY